TSPGPTEPESDPDQQPRPTMPMSAACLRQTPASTARLATQQGFALTGTTGRLRGPCEIVAVPDQFGAAWTAGQSVRPAASGSSEGAYAPGERRSKVVEAARSGAGGGGRHPIAGAAVSG